MDNTEVDNAALYTQPEDIYEVYEALSSVYQYFSIAAAFGNVHGVYKPGNVKLHPELLAKHQAYTKEKINASDSKPLFLVFHGGSGSTKEEFNTAIKSGVVKVNLDTDLQFAYLVGIRDYMLKKKVSKLIQSIKVRNSMLTRILRTTSCHKLVIPMVTISQIRSTLIQECGFEREKKL